MAAEQEVCFSEIKVSFGHLQSLIFFFAKENFNFGPKIMISDNWIINQKTSDHIFKDTVQCYVMSK